MSQRSKFYTEIRALHSEVTGSCYICKIRFSSGEKKTFIVDMGLFQENKYEHMNEVLTFNPEDICFTLITHNHIDHVGRLPLLYRRGCNSNVYCTFGTAMALPISLEDSLKIMIERAKRQKKNALRGNGRGKYGYRNVNMLHYYPMYKSEDLEETFKHIVPVSYGEWITDPKLSQVRFKMFPNAHLPGAAIIWVQISDEIQKDHDINLLFTGDWNVRNVFQGEHAFPEEMRNVYLNIITEATYGSTYKGDIKKCFRSNISQAIREEKIVLLPVISQYRAQEVLWHLKDMKEKNELPNDIPIYFCGPLGIQYLNLYRDENFTDIPEEMKNFLPEGFEFISIKGNYEVEELKYAIYVATGGMGVNGPSIAFLKTFLPIKNALIQFSSYCVEETTGRKLMELQDREEVNINGSVVKKAAQVSFTLELSGHAKADELLEFLKEFKKIKTIMVAHGNNEMKSSFANLLKRENFAKKITILNRENYVRLNKWGIMEEKNVYE